MTDTKFFINFRSLFEFGRGILLESIYTENILKYCCYNIITVI